MKRTREEYGGFLPLELAHGREYYDYLKGKLSRFNCAKAAISFVLDRLHCELIYLPYYLCPNVCHEIECHGIEVRYYYIDDMLLPLDIRDEKETCVYLVNYFGIMDKRFLEQVEKFENATVIIDNSHSFFCIPVLRKGVYNIYSCKKFFGVPDGAYLIAEQMINEFVEEKKVFSSEHALYLLDNLERGTNYCYQEKKEADKWLAENYGTISILGQKLLESIDYENVKQRRYENFLLYHENFKEINFIQCEDESVPYIYPLNVGKNIKEKLVAAKIYVPTLWSQLLQKQFYGSREYHLSNETIFLPLDQRYNNADIGFIIETVRGIL